MGNQDSACCATCTKLEEYVSLTLFQMKMQGDRRKVNKRPEVWVTILKVVLTEGSAFEFNATAFAMEDVKFNLLVEIKGSPAEIAEQLTEELAAQTGKGVKKLWAGLLGQAPPPDDDVEESPRSSPTSSPVKKPPGTSIAGRDDEDNVWNCCGGRFGREARDVAKANGGEAPAPEAMKAQEEAAPVASEGNGQPQDNREHTEFEVDMKVNMKKIAGVEKIKVDISDLDTDVEAVKFLLDNPLIRQMIQEEVSRKAAEVASEKMHSGVEKMKQRVEQMTKEWTGSAESAAPASAAPASAGPA
eukprot:gnl/TRDRNA2_/TRDRNA2_175610_c1_seq1.p1 gnl/TRDRNA2_/TRDRNA2_175610_c1~~gnl/TRDRNA2_/TRDRNA2_175610_c1_seq1.p1  ORF type:complete len:324 (+),score=75.50 gnl/TRDRNA2_/TRDRNA2_175610_c1_seq1:71-973(+)